MCANCSMLMYFVHWYIWAPTKTSDISEQLHQDIDTWYHHETLRNDRGDTKNDDSWYTCSPDFIANIKSSGTMRDTQKTMTISATSFRGCNRFSPLLIWIYVCFWICICRSIWLKTLWINLSYWSGGMPLSAAVWWKIIICKAFFGWMSCLECFFSMISKKTSNGGWH